MPGVKQKLAEAEQLASARLRRGETDDDIPSPFSLELLLSWTMGNLSAIGLQKLAASSMLDGCCNDKIAALASLGSWGQQKSNIHRDLVALVSKDMRLCDPILVSNPCLNNKQVPPLLDCQFPVLPPHLLFHSTQLHYPDCLGTFFGESRIRHFWNSIKDDDPRMQLNPAKDIPNYASKFIPLWVHGDGVEFSTDSILAFSIGSLLSTGASMDTAALLAACPKAATADLHRHGRDTWSLPFKIISWSLQALWQGIHPLKDWNNQPFKDGSLLANLAGKLIFEKGYKCIVWRLLGDLDYFANDLGYPHWQSHEF